LVECTLALLGRRPSAVEAPLCNDSACAHVTAGLAVAAPYCLCHKASLCDMSRHRWLELIGRPELHDPWPMAKGCLKRYSAGKITCLASLRGVGHGSSRDVPTFTPFYPAQSWQLYVLISRSTPATNCWMTFRKQPCSPCAINLVVCRQC